MPQLPALQLEPRNALLDLTPVNNALMGIQKQQNENRNYEIDQQRLGMDQQRFAQQSKSANLDYETKLATRSAGIAQMAMAEKDPARKAAMIERMYSLAPNYRDNLTAHGINPDDHDGVANFVIAQARGYQDPMETELQRLKLAGARSDLATADLNRQKIKREMELGPKPEYQTVNGRFLRIDKNGIADVTPQSASKQDQLDTFFGKEQAKHDFKTVKDYRTDADGASELRANLMDLKKARSETSLEGPIVGLLPALTAGQQAVDSTAENVRLGFVNKTKGAVSDAEMRIFGKATPGRGMVDAAADPIIAGMDLGAQRTQERAVFFDEWMRQKGDLNGAQSAWQSYIDANPVIQENKDGRITLNPGNVGNWRKYFSGQGQTSAAPQPSQQQGISEAEYRALPSGTRYTAPDGSSRIKP